VKIKPSDIFVTKEKSTYMHTINKAFKVYLNQLILIAALLICNSNQVLSQDVSAGEKLFKNNCAQCHKVTDQKLVGPGLKGVAARVPQPAEEWLIKWIKNSQALVKAGDAYAVKIFEEYNKSVMPSQAVTDDEIKSILAYIANPPVDPKAAATPTVDSSAPAKTDSSTVLYFLFGLILLFLILISVLGGVRNSLQRLVNQKEGLPEPVPVSYDSAYFKLELDPFVFLLSPDQNFSFYFDFHGHYSWYANFASLFKNKNSISAYDSILTMDSNSHIFKFVYMAV
jgi:mono/diheme cytochrome c family protein